MFLIKFVVSKGSTCASATATLCAAWLSSADVLSRCSSTSVSRSALRRRFCSASADSARADSAFSCPSRPCECARGMSSFTTRGLDQKQVSVPDVLRTYTHSQHLAVQQHSGRDHRAALGKRRAAQKHSGYYHRDRTHITLSCCGFLPLVTPHRHTLHQSSQKTHIEHRRAETRPGSARRRAAHGGGAAVGYSLCGSAHFMAQRLFSHREDRDNVTLLRCVSLSLVTKHRTKHFIRV